MSLSVKAAATLWRESLFASRAWLEILLQAAADGEKFLPPVLARVEIGAGQFGEPLLDLLAGGLDHGLDPAVGAAQRLGDDAVDYF
jgi:hypothetical protein